MPCFDGKTLQHFCGEALIQATLSFQRFVPQQNPKLDGWFILLREALGVLVSIASLTSVFSGYLTVK